jgi:hypothetical protein
LACFLPRGMRRQRPRVQGVRIVDSKLALLYLIIIAVITLFSVDDEYVDRMKHAITGLAVARVQAAAE